MTEGLSGFGGRVTAARLRRGSDLRRNYTQGELAKAIGVEQGTVSRWEAGALPDAETIVLIADTLGVRVGWLLVGEEPMYAPNGQPIRTTNRDIRPAPVVKLPKRLAKHGKRKDA